jgi:hypothetical protein
MKMVVSQQQSPPSKGIVHEVKTWPVWFNSFLLGSMNFDLRLNDRGYRVGDVIWMREYDPTLPGPDENRYTGREFKRRIVSVFTAEDAKRFDGGLMPGWVILGLSIADVRP